MKKSTIVVLVLLLTMATAVTLVFKKQLETAQDNQSTSTFNKKQYSVIDPASPWVVVNKKHPLNPKDYAPADLVTPNVPLRTDGDEMKLRQTTATALESMVNAAEKENIHLMLASGYRSYDLQVSVYGGFVHAEGQEATDTQSARPGYSEHQTGLAADLEPTNRACEIQQCFADTPEGKWLAAHAYAYGFIIRYTADKAAVTGYEYEPWHLRYVGLALSNQLHKQHVKTLEEFFGIPGGEYH